MSKEYTPEEIRQMQKEYLNFMMVYIDRFCNANSHRTDKFISKITELYGEKGPCDIAHGLFMNETPLSYLGDVRGKKILDVGCGATGPGNFEGWSPKIPRALQIVGAEVTGVDGRESPGEIYNHLQMDLRRQSMLSRLERECFDLAISNDFFDIFPQDGWHPVISDVYHLLKKGGAFIAHAVLDDIFNQHLDQIGFVHYSPDSDHIIAIKPNK